MGFSKSLWQQIEPLYQQILDLPFNQELTAGTLSEQRFAFYVKQDQMYLVDFSRALAMAGTRAPNAAALNAWLHFAGEAVAVEQELHEGFMRRFAAPDGLGKSPACLAYTQFLLATAALEEYPVMVVALLPCFWIYREVGTHIHARSAANNPYQDWIDTYAGEAFSASVDRAIALTDEAAEGASEAVRQRMTEAFVLSSRLEWMFWDSAYRMETWPQVSGA